MSNLIRGTPMGMNSTSQVYQNPNMLSQVAGVGLTGAAMKNAGMFAEGGTVQHRPAGLVELALSKMYKG